jgi:endonuclease/exonuclease/phosphatase family metal-dependent hydrolase
MFLYSWNILHIIHEIKHVGNISAVINQYKILNNFGNENNRQKDIINNLKLFLETDEPTIICLQEVPNDYLEELKTIPNIKIFEYKYSRLPTLPSQYKNSPYKNNSEFLVILTKNIENPHSFDVIRFSDPGKACISIKVDETNYCNVHMPFKDDEFQNSLELVVKKFINEKTVICGDFNKTHFWINKLLSNIKISNNLGILAENIFQLVENNTTTHITINKDKTENKKIYDHYLLGGFNAVSEKNLEVFPVVSSDHFPIKLVL